MSSRPDKKLTPKELLFVEALLGPAAGNGTKAARAAGYAAGSARITASKLLKKAHIQAALTNKKNALATAATVASAIVRAKVMDGDEALERLSTYARADIGAVLPPDHWVQKLPVEARAIIKEIRPTEAGDVIKLHDAMKATELLAKAGGKLKEVVQVESLEDLLARSWKVGRPSGAAA